MIVSNLAFFQTTPIWAIILAFFVGYGLGSIPFGLLLTKWAGTQNLREIGSRNIGATNVLRTGRKDLAAATLLLDALKGTAAVLLIGAVSSYPATLVAALGAFLGHLFPVWLEFKGGKGVATFLGLALGLWWPAALVFAIVWLSVAFLSRYSSLSALCATLAVILAFVFAGQRYAAVLFGILSLLLWLKHRPNIERLLAGTESRIGKSNS